jgi:hypothetical protein
MNSDFSPYQGQQHEAISQNLQAAAINKMVTGNRGELGKANLPNDMRNTIKSLARQENKVYKAYEALANKIINRVAKNAMKETGAVQAAGLTQNLQNCFRCATVGSTNTNRLQTNTYIPSYVLDANLVNQARNQLPNKYKDFIVVETTASPDQGKGYVQIYTSALGTLMGKFEEAANKGIVYQWGVWKNTLATMPDTTQFKKRTANNGKDNGKYAANQALLIRAAGMGCRSTCLTADNANAPNKPPIKQDSQGTSVTGQCAPCANFSRISNKQLDQQNRFHLRSRHRLFLESSRLAPDKKSHCQTSRERTQRCQITPMQTGLLAKAAHQMHPQPQLPILSSLSIVLQLVGVDWAVAAVQLRWWELRAPAGYMEVCLCFLLQYLVVPHRMCDVHSSHLRLCFCLQRFPTHAIAMDSCITKCHRV